jgi:GAF domain-containing protein/HAMP domain-containing protein
VDSNEQSHKLYGKRLPRLGGRFISRIEISSQILASFIAALLGLDFVYVTTGLSREQLIKWLVSTIIAIVLVNIFHYIYLSFISRHARKFLDYIFKNQPLPADSDEFAAWNEIIAFPKRSLIALVFLIIAVLIAPVVAYMRWSEGLDLSQTFYMIFGGFLSAIVAIIMNFLYLDTQLGPARQALLPADLSPQDIRVTFSQRFRQYFVTLAMLLVSMIALGGVSFQKINIIANSGSNFQAVFSAFQTQLIIMGVILLGIGAYLANRLVFMLTKPTQEMTRIIEKVEKGDYSERAPIITSDDLGRLTIHFNHMIDELQKTQTTLEQQVQERTASLEKRGKQLQAAAQVAREAASLPDLNQMISQTVNLISEQFGFYHAGIFLLDDTGEYVVLRAASSEGGKNMLARGHKLAVGTQGIVGSVALNNRSRIAMDVGTDREFFNNPDLPLTRSEAALPLTVQNKVIGVLDIQSVEEAKFTTSDIEVLQILADQVALAIQNARLITESQNAVQRLEAITAENISRAWKGQLHTTKNVYRYSSAGLVPTIRAGSQSSPGKERKDYLNIPIALRGQRIGTISLYRKGNNTWSDSDLSLLQEVSTQVGLALENARLVQDTQLRAEREKTLSQVAAHMRETLDMDSVIQTAVREMKQSLNLDKAEIRLQLDDRTNTDAQPRLS